jgi:hypothetical protein
LAAALEASDGVGAGGLGAAHVGVPLALVHVDAESPVRLKPWWTMDKTLLDVNRLECLYLASLFSPAYP